MNDKERQSAADMEEARAKLLEWTETALSAT